jgi:hypothetical protein
MRRDFYIVWYRKSRGYKLELIPPNELRAIKKRFTKLIDWGTVNEEPLPGNPHWQALFMTEKERFPRIPGFEGQDTVSYIDSVDYRSDFKTLPPGAIVARIFRERNANNYYWLERRGNQWVKPAPGHHIDNYSLFRNNGIDPNAPFSLAYPYKFVFFDSDLAIHQTNSMAEKERLARDPDMRYLLVLEIKPEDFTDKEIARPQSKPQPNPNNKNPNNKNPNNKKKRRSRPAKKM